MFTNTVQNCSLFLSNSGYSLDCGLYLGKSMELELDFYTLVDLTSEDSPSWCGSIGQSIIPYAKRLGVRFLVKAHPRWWV